MIITNNIVRVEAALPQFGGVINSIKFGGTEFIDSDDIGQLAQTAIQWDDQGEANNPTQAGSLNGTPSQIIASASTSTSISVLNKPRFWTPYQGQQVSNDQIAYTIHLNHLGNPHLLRWVCDWYVGSAHIVGMLENLTTYSPPEFNSVYSFDPLSVKKSDINWAQSPFPPFGWTNNSGRDAIIAYRGDKKRCIGLYGQGDNTLNIYGAIYPFTIKLDVACKVFNTTPGQVVSREVFIAIGTLGDVVGALTDLRSSL